jgi:hypothetical protein
LQQLGVSDQLRETAHSQGSHDLTAFLRDEFEIVDHHLGQADEILAAQHIVLRGDARGAIIQMTDPQVLAAQGNHRRSTETEALGADQGRLDHIETRLQAAIGLQTDAMAQLIGAQGLMGLRKTQFPRCAGILDGR